MAEWTKAEQLPELHDDVFIDGDERIYFKASDPVLVVYNTDEMTIAVYERDIDIDFEAWIDWHSSDVLHSVSHWMPLPELPKEADND